MLSWYQYTLWIAPAVGQCLIALFGRRRSADFPVFRAYVFFHIVQLPVELYSYFHSRALYFYAFWIMQALDFLLVIAVLEEVFSIVLHDYAALRRLATKLYRGTVLVLIAIAFCSALLAHGTETDRTVAGLLTLDAASMFVQLGALGILFFLARMLVLGWKDFPFGIALGYGVMASVQLATSLLRAYLGACGTPGYVVLRPLAYNLAVLIWLFYAARRERPASPSACPPVLDVSRWNEALEKISRS